MGQEQRTKEKIFRLTEEEDQKLEDLVKLCHKMAFIKKATVQDFMIFAINCARAYCKQAYETAKGLGGAKGA